MVDIKIYVEGGGDQARLKIKCRAGFRQFFEKALPKGNMPKIIACGNRNEAYDRFCTAIFEYRNTFCILLVDSEGAVKKNAKRWVYTKRSDGWDTPDNANEENLHFMVQCMENWFMADKECLADFYGQGFLLNSLPNNPQVERIPKNDIFNGLNNATRKTKSKGKYGKGSHSFDILSSIDPVKVCHASPHANILMDVLKNKVSG